MERVRIFRSAPFFFFRFFHSQESTHCLLRLPAKRKHSRIQGSVKLTLTIIPRSFTMHDPRVTLEAYGRTGANRQHRLSCRLQSARAEMDIPLRGCLHNTPQDSTYTHTAWCCCFMSFTTLQVKRLPSSRLLQTLLTVRIVCSQF